MFETLYSKPATTRYEVQTERGAKALGRKGTGTARKRGRDERYTFTPSCGRPGYY